MRCTETTVVRESLCFLLVKILTPCLTVLLSYRSVVLNLLRLEDHLQILSLSRGPPLKILPRKIAKISLFVCLYPCKMKKLPLLADHQVDVRGPQVKNRCNRSQGKTVKHTMKLLESTALMNKEVLINIYKFF